MTYRDIESKVTGISYQSIQRHKASGHIMDKIVNKVAKRDSIDVRDIIDNLVTIRDKANAKSDTVSDQYLAPIQRVAVESNKVLLSAGFDMAKLQLDRDKLQAAKDGQGGDKLTRAADYMRLHHPDELEAYCAYVDSK